MADAVSSLECLNVKIFADGADLGQIREMAAHSWIRGFTTNPTLMRKAGISDYQAFAREAIEIVAPRPISFEVFADDLHEMECQAKLIAQWGSNVNVKIPITTTKGESCAPLIARLSRAGVVVNVTAMMTLEQVRTTVDALDPSVGAILSVFAGRIADTAVDPVPVMREAVAIAAARPKAEVLWASPRELLNVYQADECGCHIITATTDILAKRVFVGRDLDAFSLETVSMFYRDAQAAGYTL